MIVGLRGTIQSKLVSWILRLSSTGAHIDQSRLGRPRHQFFEEEAGQNCLSMAVDIGGSENGVCGKVCRFLMLKFSHIVDQDCHILTLK